MPCFRKKLFNFIFDKEIWVSTAIGGTGWALFWVVGGYIAFFTKTTPWWFKLIYVGLLGIGLYFLCIGLDNFVQKKLRNRECKNIEKHEKAVRKAK